MEKGSIVVITYGHNKVLNEPFKRIAQFKYYNMDDNPVCCPVGEVDTQSSFVLRLDEGATMRLATEKDKKTITYER